MAFLRRFKRLPSRLKITYLILILVVVLGIATFVWVALSGKLSSMAAGETASFRLSYPSEVQVGNSFSVDIYVNTGIGVKTIAVNSLHYNTALLELKDSSPNDGIQIVEYQVGDLTVTQNTANVTDGTITYILQGNNTTYQGNDTRIATARFVALGSGTADFTFDFNPGNPTTLGDCDVIATINNEDVDILRSASSSHINILDVSVPTTTTDDGGGGEKVTHMECFAPKKVCLRVNGPGDNECSVYADCLRTPTPEPTPEITPTPEEIINENNQTNEIAQVENPTPTPEITPTLIPSITPTLILPETPSESPVIEIAGIGISRTMSIVLFIGVPLLITLIVYLIWYYSKKKKGDFLSSSKKDDDDEII